MKDFFENIFFIEKISKNIYKIFCQLVLVHNPTPTKKLANKSCDRLWRSDFYNKDSEKDRVQDINLNQIKLKVNYTFDKDEKTATNVEHVKDEDVVMKTFLDVTITEAKGHMSNIEQNLQRN